MTQDTQTQPGSDDTIAGFSFEAALAELESIVEQLESGRISLYDAIDAYSRGMQLKAQCQKRLEEARMKVEKIRLPQAGSSDSQPSSEPFSEDV